MRVKSISINHFRSISDIELTFPEGKPLVLFGPNNAGKSNIIAAIHRFLGEYYPPNINMLDSDWFMRDKAKYSSCEIGCVFDSPYAKGNCALWVHYETEPAKCEFRDSYGQKVWVNNDERRAIQSFLVDAERSIGYQLSYSSRFTLLSKFSHAVHGAIDDAGKKALKESFEEIKTVFKGIPEYSEFADAFTNTISDAVQGFAHHLEVDFSAYDPNNYANAMRILAKEGNDVRTFEEFGTGEQQVLLMAFAKAYMEVFGAESVILILEEPEAHLHPLAQRWLKEYIYGLCASGMQIVVSTHSADFLDPSNLQGLVKVSKDAFGTTHAIQLGPGELVRQCIENGVPSNKISELGVADHYAARLTPDSLKGLFAKTVLLVEGATEFFALPIYLANAGCSFAKENIEIINCGGKQSIPAYARLFSAYGIRVFCLFDCDRGKDNEEISSYLGLGTMETQGSGFVLGNDWAYNIKDFEDTLRLQVPEYVNLENEAMNVYKVSGKPATAYVAARLCVTIPRFVNDLTNALKGGTSPSLASTPAQPGPKEQALATDPWRDDSLYQMESFNSFPDEADDIPF